jgi:uncharacterized protein (TIGR01777 family)
MSNILITGGTGFIGSAIVKHLAASGHRLVVVSRTPRVSSPEDAVQYVVWPSDMSKAEQLSGEPDVVINLAGDPINKGRWTADKKRSIIESRVHSTEKVLTYMNNSVKKPKLLINASAIGYYGFSDEREFTEHDLIEPHNFLTEVSEKWEAEALKAERLGVRVVLARFGIVLGKSGGALAPMILPYKLFGGGKVASGKQWLSWIHIHDVVSLVEHIMNHQTIRGPVNFTAPEPMRMNQFGQTIGAVLGRPHWLPVPAFALRILFGEMGDLLIKGQKVLPQVALDGGYKFKYSDARSALEHLLQPAKGQLS